MRMLFTWSYEGWGNSTREPLRAFDAVEQARGFEPPVFVDVRVRRQVRAMGFQEDTFEQRVGRAHCCWLPGLEVADAPLRAAGGGGGCGASLLARARQRRSEALLEVFRLA